MRRSRKRPIIIVATLVVLGAGVAIAPSAIASWRRPGDDRRSLTGLEVQSLDGRGNNRQHPEWGQAGTPYSRVARANYADGRGRPVAGPNSRAVSNRIFNDVSHNTFSEHRVTQWGQVWGQWIDHNIGLRDANGEAANIPFDANDPMEIFTNDLGSIPFIRSKAAPGTGTSSRNPREQINTVGSYIDASTVYGDTNGRLEWLRDGPVDGRLGNNAATLLLPNNLLPRRDARGNAATAPAMDVDGRLAAQPAKAMVAGDTRANENIALAATHTLFAREHNRIVAQLPNFLSNEQKFQIARRIVIAEVQYITYNEFLPAMGVRLSQYRGYNPRVDANLTNEFATVGYRAHSMIHGEFELLADADRYNEAQREALEKASVEVEEGDEEGEVELVVSLNVAFFNPDVLELVQLGPMLHALGLESEYRNDEQIDNQLRSVLFQVPVTDNIECLDGPTQPECFKGVMDVGAIDVERGRDHGMPSYNDLRRAYGLAPKTSFTAITGEATDAFPNDPELTPGAEGNDPDSIDVVKLLDIDGNDIALDSEEAEAEAVTTIRRTTIAARLKAVYGSVDKIDAFTGMLAENHQGNADMGELQQAIWKQQFEDLRDGDRFFFGNDPGLTQIRRWTGIDFRKNLGDLIALNTDIPRSELAANVFVGQPEPPAAGSNAVVPPANANFEQPAANGQIGGVDATSLVPAMLRAAPRTARRRRRHLV